MVTTNYSFVTDWQSNADVHITTVCTVHIGNKICSIQYYTSVLYRLLIVILCEMYFRQWHYRNSCPQFSLVYIFKNELLMGAMWYWIMFHFYFEHVSYSCFFLDMSLLWKYL